jgi:hypothetical protein
MRGESPKEIPMRQDFKDWRSLLEQRASAFNDPTASTKMNSEKFMSLRKQFADTVVEHITYLADTLPPDVAKKECIGFIEELIDRDSKNLQTLIMRFPEERTALFNLYEGDIACHRGLLADLKEISVEAQ